MFPFSVKGVKIKENNFVFLANAFVKDNSCYIKTHFVRLSKITSQIEGITVKINSIDSQRKFGIFTEYFSPLK